jgi:hypothetical protein
MSTEDLTQTGLRVGGWLPPYRASGQDIALASECRAVPECHPVAAGQPWRYLPPRRYRVSRRYRRAAAPFPLGYVSAPLAGMTVLAVALAGLTVTFLTGPATTHSAPGDTRLPSVPALLPQIPFEPAGLEPSALPAADLQVTVARRLVARPTAAQAGGGQGSAAQPGNPAAPADPGSPAQLIVGATIGLELSNHPGYRVRHQNFRGRVDWIDADSSSLDRADSRFTVRSRANGCVSLESVNYPGRFLRHRNFVIRLDRQDGSALFAADSTFCPVYRRSGALVLRSVNYPDRYITEDDSELTLTSEATRFTVRPAL